MMMKKIHRELTNKNKVESNVLSNSLLVNEEKDFSFKMVFNGQQHFKFAKKEIKLFPDHFILLEPGTSYQSFIDANEPVKTLSVSMTSAFVQDFHASHYIKDELFLDSISGEIVFPVQSIYAFKGDMLFNMQNLYKRLEEEDHHDMLINEYLQHCLIIYYSKYHKESRNELMNLNFVRTTTKKEIFRRLSLAREFISNNYNKKFSLEDVATAACLSVNHLLRTFKQAFGISPYQYLTEVRLNRAKILLETGHSSVNEIVVQVGFESPSSFIKLFKSNFNCTPLKHRKSLIYQLN